MAVVFVTSASTSPWSKPGDWADAGHTVRLIGAGGRGGTAIAGTTYRGGPGGGGGAHVLLTRTSGVLASTTNFLVGIDNSSITDRTTGATCWGSASFANCYYAEAGEGGGVGGTDFNGGLGGDATTTSVGSPSGPAYTASLNNSGGAGGTLTSPTVSGGGGGGAGGPSGVGGDGGATTTVSRGGGGGGAGNGGGSATATSGVNGTAGAGAGGGAGGTSGSAAGNATGTDGSGGGGAFFSAIASASTIGGIGGVNALYTQTSDSATAGSGGGGGGGGANSNTTAGATSSGGNGGNYGAGGGGAGGCRSTTSTRTPGTGASGLIVITYTAAPGATISYQGAVTTSGGASSRTLSFTATSAAGQERLVALLAMSDDVGFTTFSSVQIDGQSATQVGAYVSAKDFGGTQNGPIIGFFRAAGTSGTSVNVTCTTATVFDVRGVLWNLTNAGALLDTASHSDDHPVAGNVSLDIDTATGGAVAAVFLAYNSTIKACTWTGLTERYDGGADSLYGGDWFSAADLNAGSASTPLTVTATLPADFSGQSAIAGMAVSFGVAISGLDTVSVTQASVTFTGKTVTVRELDLIPVLKASVTYTGKTVTILDVIPVLKASVTFAGKTVLIIDRDVIPVLKASVVFAGKAVGLVEPGLDSIAVDKASVTFTGKTVTLLDIGIDVIPVGKANILFIGQNVTITGTGEPPVIGLPGGGGGFYARIDYGRKKRRRFRALEEIEKRLDERIERLEAESQEKQQEFATVLGSFSTGQTGEFVSEQYENLLRQQAQITAMLHEAQKRAEKVRQEKIQLAQLARQAAEAADEEEAITMLLLT